MLHDMPYDEWADRMDDWNPRFDGQVQVSDTVRVRVGGLEADLEATVKASLEEGDCRSAYVFPEVYEVVVRAGDETYTFEIPDLVPEWYGDPDDLDIDDEEFMQDVVFEFSCELVRSLGFGVVQPDGTVGEVFWGDDWLPIDEDGIVFE